MRQCGIMECGHACACIHGAAGNYVSNFVMALSAGKAGNI